MSERSPFSPAVMAKQLAGAKDTAFQKFSVDEVRTMLLGLQLKARHLISSTKSAQSQGPEDLFQDTLTKMLRYGSDAVPDIRRLKGLAQKIMLHTFLSNLRPRIVHMLEPPLRNALGGEDADGNTENEWLDNVATKESIKRGLTDPTQYESKVVSAFAASQKLNDLRLKIEQGHAKFGAEFLDFFESLISPDGLTAVNLRNKNYNIERVRLEEIRATQGRKKISRRQLDRYIEYLLEEAHHLIEDTEHKRELQQAPPDDSKSDALDSKSEL